jgi:1-phosphatidylinositol-3-phosphate 5-kinase
MPTPKAKPSSLPSLPHSPSEDSLVSKISSSRRSSFDSKAEDSIAPASALAKLEMLKAHVQEKQQVLERMVTIIPPTGLNDVRRKFKSEGKRLKCKIETWLNKYFKPLNLASGHHLMQINLQPPNWWDSKCHAVPGSRFIVKDGDWGTVIASTLG